MGKASAPPPVDYQGLSQQNQQNSLELARFNLENNRVNQYTPFGSSTWSYTPAAGGGQSSAPPAAPAPPPRQIWVPGGYESDPNAESGGNGMWREGHYEPVLYSGPPTPPAPAPAPGMGQGGTWSQNISFSPEQQRLYDAQMQLSQGLASTAQSQLGSVQNSLSQPFSTSGFTPWANVPQGGTSAQSRLPVQGLDMQRYQVQPMNIQRQSLPTMGSLSSGNVSAVGGTPLQTEVNMTGVRQLPGQIDDASRKRVEEALMSRINPQYQADEQALRTRLLNSGIEVGTDAYNREMNNFGQRLNDARMQAVLAGGQEETRQVGLQQGLQQQEFDQAVGRGRFHNDASQMDFSRAFSNAQLQQQAAAINNNAAIQSYMAQLQGQGQDFNQQLQIGQYQDQMAGNQFMRDLQGANFANSAADTQTQRQMQIDNMVQAMALQNAQFGNTQRAQQFNEQQFLRQLPMSELNALRNGSQVQSPSFPQYFSANANGGGDALQAGALQGRDAMAQYQADMQNSSSTMGTVGSIAAMVAMYF